MPQIISWAARPACLGFVSPTRAFRAFLLGSVLVSVASAQSACPPVEAGKLIPSGALPLDEFGFDIDIDGDVAVVGAILSDRDKENETGSIYIYEREGGQWIFVQQIIPDDGRDGDRFGYSVSVHGEWLAVGAPLVDGPQGSDTGAVYFYRRGDDGWEFHQEVEPEDPLADSLFGHDVDLSGMACAIGRPQANNATGSAYVFELGVGDTWGQKSVLIDPNPGQQYAFGESVAIDDAAGTAAVGARYVPSLTRAQGRVHIYTREAQGWLLQATITPAAGNTMDLFGWPVALEGDTILAGAVQANGATFFSGAAYIFTRSGTTWTERSKLAAMDGSILDLFGFSVALRGETALIGSVFYSGSSGIGQGAAYLFRRSGATWIQQHRYLASDAAEQNFLGRSAALGEGAAMIGSYNFLPGGEYLNDAVYVLDTSIEPPGIAVQPFPVTAVAGESAIFTVTASGTGPFGYRWRRNGVTLDDGPRITGSSSDRLIILPALEPDAGEYACTITTDCGQVSTALAVLTVLPCIEVTAQPLSRNVFAGDSVSFTVGTTGPADRLFRWFRGGEPLTDTMQITGSQTATLTINNVSSGASGFFSCRISAPCGMQVSAEAELIVLPAPCHGDANHDGSINFVDIATILAMWGMVSPPGGIGDGNGDGFVTFLDVAVTLVNWGSMCP